jgi:glycosyltransferase involved in cell wall biosynthesis
VRVGLDLLYLLPGRVGGTETYARELVSALTAAAPGDRFVAFVNRESRGWDLGDRANLEVVHCEVRASSRARRYAFEQLRLPSLLARSGVDLVHSLGYVGPLRPPCPHVVTVHDLIYRGFAPHLATGRRLVLRTFVRATARRADRVITDSANSAAELVADIGLLEREVVVVPLAARTDLVPAGRDPRVPTPYVLALSSASPSKNLPRLVEAMLRSGAFGRHHLVIAGNLPDDGSVQRAAGAAPRGRVHLVGYVPDDELADLLAGADLFAFPSTYEGFGMPVLDAQRLGVPVVCSDAASLPEVAGDGAVLVTPTSVPAMAAGLRAVLEDPARRAELVALGRRNAARFSWEDTAARTLAVYRSVLAERGLR